jgi:hypothetical protein
MKDFCIEQDDAPDNVAKARELLGERVRVFQTHNKPLQ